MTGNLDDAPNHAYFYPGLVNVQCIVFTVLKVNPEKFSLVDKHANKD